MEAGLTVCRARFFKAIAFAAAFAAAAAILISAFSAGAGADPGCDLVAAPSGLDSTPGTELQPFRTVGRLVASLAPGQSGCLRAGTYPERVSITRGGQAGAPVTLQSYPGEQAVIVGRVVIDAAYVEIRSLKLVGISLESAASPLVTASNVLLQDNEITNGHTANCVMIGTVLRRVVSVTVRANRIHDCGVIPSTNRHSGVNVVNAAGTAITRNWIFDNADRGVQLSPDADDSRVALNVIDGNGEGVLFAGSDSTTSDGNVVESNVITNSLIRDNVESHWPSPSRIGQGNLVQSNCIFGGLRDDGDGGIADLRDGFTADSNLIVDPQYVNRAAHDYRLRLKSPCQLVFGNQPGVSCNKFASPSGSDGAAGTFAAPYRTVNHLAEWLEPGETGCLRAGVFDEDVRIANGGSLGAPLKITSYPGERAAVVGRMVVTDAANFVTVAGLYLDGTNVQRLPSPTIHGDDVNFTGNEVTNNHTAICFILGTNEYGRAKRTLIQFNRIHDCGTLPANNHEHGIYVEASDDAEIVDNWIYDNADRGVQMYPDSQHSYIARNVIDSNGEGVIFSRESGGNIVEHNIISNSELRWNIEQWELTGLGNVARRNCVWTTRSDYSDNGGVQPANEFDAVRNLVAEPGFVDPASKDFRVALTSPCLATYTSSLIVPF